MFLKKYLFLALYYGLFRKLPRSTFPVLGTFFKSCRYFSCTQIFRYCGKNVNIERNAYFGKGFELEIGDYSGLGYGCSVPSNIKIGKYVMMAPEVFISGKNHEFSDTSTPMSKQGVRIGEKSVIEDDVWIGQRSIINSGRVIKRGSILASATVLVKDYPEYSIIGGNPSQLIRNRNGDSGQKTNT